MSTIRDAKSSDQRISKKLNFSDIISYLWPTSPVKLMEELWAKSIFGWKLDMRILGRGALKFNWVLWSFESLLGCLQLGPVTSCNPVFLSLVAQFFRKKPIVNCSRGYFFDRYVFMYTLCMKISVEYSKFPLFLLLNLR